MTKALLTSKDIQLFIYEVIESQLTRKDLVNMEELSKRLSLSTHYIRKYMKMGMPYILRKHKIRFDIPVVLDWLKENKLHKEYL